MASSSENRSAYLQALCRTVPFHITEKVLQNPTEEAIARQSFVGSVMFADLVGFTAFGEAFAQRQDGCSDLSRVLDRLFNGMLEKAVFPYRGYVVQFGGDSITVVFRGEQHALRCAATALACRNIVRNECIHIGGEKQMPLMIRIGLASGGVRLPVVGDLARRVSLCAGSTAHRALELQKKAQPNGILADSAIIQAVGTAAVLGEPADNAVYLEELNHWPQQQPLVDLSRHLHDQIEEKIALLEPFVPQPLAVRLKTTPLGWRMEGEIRQVVVLFAEIWGLDDDNIDQKGAVAASRNMSRSLLRCFYKFGGLISKVDLADKGHRVMVLFGLHAPAENDAERALTAALEAVTRIKGFTHSHDTTISIKIGVHSGRVFFGAIGSDHKHDITVIGDSVNVAARTTAAAKPFEILASDSVMEPVLSRFDHSSRRPIWVKGKQTPLNIHQVHGVTEDRAHYIRLRESKRYSAGRQQQQLQLATIVDQAYAGQSQIIGICGEAGMGKSYLLTGIIDEWIARGGSGVLGRCNYTTRATPLAPIKVMINNYIGLTGDEDELYRRERVREAILTRFHYRDGAQALISLLQPVERPDGTDETLLDASDVYSRERLLGNVSQFIEQRVAQEPLLYIIEDLHFADSLTLQLVSHLTSMPRDNPFIIIGTYRPKPHLLSMRRLLDQEIVLSNLNNEQTEELLCNELNAREVSSDLTDFLRQRTEGNPAYLVEVTRFLTEHKLILVQHGVVKVPDPGLSLLDEIVPQSLAHVALARLEGLGEVERRLLRTASAIGSNFSRALLENASVHNMETEQVYSAVDALKTQNVLETDSSEHPGYRFRDEVVRAVTYKTIPELDRVSTHKRIATALAQLPKSDPRRTAATLAFHWERSHEYRKALACYQTAIELAASAALDRDTKRLAQHWQLVADKLPQEVTAKGAARVHLCVMIAAGRSGEWPETTKRYKLLLSEFASQLDERSHNTVDFWIARTYLALGDPEKARHKLEALYRCAVDEERRFDAALLLVLIFTDAQDFQRASSWIKNAQAKAGDDIMRLALVDFRQGTLLLYTGDLERARELLKRAQQTAQQHNLTQLNGTATLNLAYCDLISCSFDQARKGFENALTLHRAADDRAKEAMDLVNLGQAYLWDSRLNDARGPLERGLALAEQLDDLQTAAEARVHLGAVIAATEDPLAGLALCKKGMEQAEQSGVSEVVTAARLHLLRLQLLRRDSEACQETLRQLEQQQEALNTPLFQSVYKELGQGVLDLGQD